jgi:hypothetical protein
LETGFFARQKARLVAAMGELKITGDQLATRVTMDEKNGRPLMIEQFQQRYDMRAKLGKIRRFGISP